MFRTKFQISNSNDSLVVAVKLQIVRQIKFFFTGMSFYSLQTNNLDGVTSFSKIYYHMYFKGSKIYSASVIPTSELHTASFTGVMISS